MGATDPRVLINLLHDLSDRLRRTVAEGNDVAKGAKWLQAQIGEQVSQTAHSSRHGLGVSQEDFAHAAETVAAVERSHWQDQVAAANRAVQTARANLQYARARLAACQQPVYRPGPQGRPVAVYRDCSGCEHAVDVAEREVGIAQDYLEDCRASLAQAEGAEQLVATARPHVSEAEAVINVAAQTVVAARELAIESETAARAELAVGGEAVRHAGEAAKALQQAEGHAHRSLRDFADGENIARTAEHDLNKRIGSLQLLNRPHPLP
jgi:hypothetical protein